MQNKQFDETAESILSACPVLAKEQYIQRHDRVCAELYCNICKEIGEKLCNKHRYDHLRKLVQKGHELKLPPCGTKSANRQNCF